MNEKLKSFLTILAGLAPVIMASFPETAPYAGLVQHAIGAAESIPGASGPQKKAAALALVTDGMAAANQVAGHTIVDPTTVAIAVSDGIDTTIEAVNLLQKAKADAAARDAAAAAAAAVPVV